MLSQLPTKVEQTHTYTHTLMLNRGAWSCYFDIGDLKGL